MKKERLQSYTTYKDRRQTLRNDPTMAELVLWQKLNHGQLGHKFRRQQSIGHYIVDFYCPTAKVIVELDGSIHGEGNNREKDKTRQLFLEAQGFIVLRYRNDQIKHEMTTVLQDIKRYCETAINHPASDCGRSGPSFPRRGKINSSSPEPVPSQVEGRGESD